jgi:uncharacterized membrane protein YjfL (UPF0719 family)
MFSHYNTTFSVVTLCLHCIATITNVTHYHCYTVVIVVLLHASYTVVTLYYHTLSLLHSSDNISVTLLLHCCYIVVTLLLHCATTFTSITHYHWYTVVIVAVLQCRYTVVELQLHYQHCHTITVTQE